MRICTAIDRKLLKLTWFENKEQYEEKKMNWETMRKKAVGVARNFVIPNIELKIEQARQSQLVPFEAEILSAVNKRNLFGCDEVDLVFICEVINSEYFQFLDWLFIRHLKSQNQ